MTFTCVHHGYDKLTRQSWYWLQLDLHFVEEYRRLIVSHYHVPRAQFESSKCIWYKGDLRIRLEYENDQTEESVDLSFIRKDITPLRLCKVFETKLTHKFFLEME